MRLSPFLAVSMMIAATPVLAHTGHHAAPGFTDGFAHPFGGLDHMLAMVSVGLFAAGLGGRALWAVPASFVFMMLVGGVMGFTGIEVPAVEIGIATSVVVLGAVLATGSIRFISVAMTLTGLFAIFHGYAHGAEMPSESAAALYCLGFMMATALLHIAGIAIGIIFGHRQIFYRLAGVGISLTGVVLSLS
jgi:urease accessory protein